MTSVQSPPSHQPPETIALSAKEWLQKTYLILGIIP